MVSNDDFDGKATHLNCFYLHINFEQIYPKPAIVFSRSDPRNYFVVVVDKTLQKNVMNTRDFNCC